VPPLNINIESEDSVFVLCCPGVPLVCQFRFPALGKQELDLDPELVQVGRFGNVPAQFLQIRRRDSSEYLPGAHDCFEVFFVKGHSFTRTRGTTLPAGQKGYR
jgi:hypothetical protein